MQIIKPVMHQPKRSLVIHAPNVHSGGGAVLLRMLLSGLEDAPCVLQVDARFKLPEDCSGSLSVIRIRPTLFQRFLAERRLRVLAKASITVLCFGNLPPLFKLRQRTIVFLQSRYLLGSSLSLLNFKPRVRVFLERLWLRSRYKLASQYWVQTDTMRSLALKTCLSRCDVQVKPFFNMTLPEAPELSDKSPGSFHFIYPASSEGHKNHIRLLKAWVLLAEMGQFPRLQLTLCSQDETFLQSVVKQYHLNVEFLGNVSHQRLMEVYKQVDALIFPSLFESYGLPLLEAASVKLPIIASECDYVRDLLDPSETFDPSSERSIMRAMMRFMQTVTPREAILSPQQFVKQLIDREVLR